MSDNPNKDKKILKMIGITVGIVLILYVGSYFGITRYNNWAGGGKKGVMYAPIWITDNDLHEKINMFGYYFYYPVYCLDKLIFHWSFVNIMYELG